MKKTPITNLAVVHRRGRIFRKNIGAWVLLLPSLFCVYFLILRPQILNVAYSFFDMRGFTVTDFVGIDNYKRVVADPVFLKAFKNTWVYVLWSLVVGLPLPFFIAIALNEIRRFRKTSRVIVYLPAVLPAVAVSTLWYFIYYPDGSGLLNMFLGKFGVEPYIWLQDGRWTILYIIFSMTWSAAGSTALYYFAGLQGINHELYEAAIIDGAGFFRRHLTVTIPQMSGMIALFAIRQCIAVFNVMDQPMQMTDGGPNNASVSLGLLSYRYAFANYRPQMAMALGVLMMLVTVVFAVIYFWLDKKLEDSQM